jgi:hypothetical protein
MKIDFILAAVAAMTMTSAFANGVEKHLPMDAHNVKIASAELAEYATSSTHVWSNSGDGGGYDINHYSTELQVTVTYESQDNTDVPQSNVEGGSPYDSTTPTVVFYVPLTDAQIAQVKSKQVDPRSLVSLMVVTKTVSVPDSSHEYICSYGNEGNEPLYGCVEPATPMVNVTLPVLTLSTK